MPPGAKRKKLRDTPPAVNVSDLPADLAAAAINFLGAESIQLVAASSTLLANVVASIEPWQRDGMFGKHMWCISNPVHTILLRARNEFLKEVAQLAEHPWEFIVYCDDTTADTDLRFVSRLTEVSQIVYHAPSRWGRHLVTPAGLGHLVALRRLRSLTISGVTVEGVEQFSFLTSLHMSHCNVSEGDIAKIAEVMVQLTDLSVDHCSTLTSKTAGLIASRLKQLNSLSLQSCHCLTDKGVEALATLPSLLSLNIRDCQKVSSAAVVHLAKTSTLLTNLNISDIINVGDDAIRVVATLPALTVLNVSGLWRLTDSIGPFLARHAILSTLNLGAATRLTDLVVAHISSIPTLTELSLCDCSLVTDAGIAHLAAREPTLEILSVRGIMSLTDAAVIETICRLSCLRKLDLGYLSCCTNTAVSAIAERLKKLESLALSRWRNLTDGGVIHLFHMPRLSCLCIEGCFLVSNTCRRRTENRFRYPG